MNQLSECGEIYRVIKQRRNGIGFLEGTILFSLTEGDQYPFVIPLDNVIKQYPQIKEETFIDREYRKDLSNSIMEEMFIKDTIDMGNVEKITPIMCRGNGTFHWILQKTKDK